MFDPNPLGGEKQNEMANIFLVLKAVQRLLTCDNSQDNHQKNLPCLIEKKKRVEETNNCATHSTYMAQ